MSMGIARGELTLDKSQMHAELHSLSSSDIDDLRSYRLGDEFCVWLTALIGPKGAPGEEIFQLCVCSPSWLAAEVGRQEFVSGRFLMITADFNYDAIERHVRKRISAATGRDWYEVASKLSRWSDWEFEDYVEYKET